jgi:hypothetical protein
MIIYQKKRRSDCLSENNDDHDYLSENNDDHDKYDTK